MQHTVASFRIKPMNDTNIPTNSRKASEEALIADRREILAMTPEKALTAIAEHPMPVSLVQSMAEEDFHLLVHAVGPDDAHPVLALASNQQWEYLLDVETWFKDRMDTHALTVWIKRLLKADPDRLTHWITHDKLDELVLYLFRNIDLHIREYEQDPSEIDKGFFTEDQTYYVRLQPYPTSYKQPQKERDELIKDLLRRLAVYDPVGYRDMLIETTAIVPAEAEEELYRLHKARLAEKGFLPFEEAVGVYQALSVADLAKRTPKPQRVGGRVVDSYPLPIEAAQPDATANLFARTLAGIQDSSTLHRLQSEFAGLCNQVIAADQRKIREKIGLEQIVTKVGDYISIGMEKAAIDARKTPYGEASLLQTYFLGDLFRVGYGCALALKWRAEKWQRGSWFTGAGLPLSFWGEAWLGTLGGLLIKKPLFYDNYATGVLYREFATLADIQHTDSILDKIIAFDDLLSLISSNIKAAQLPSFITYQNLMLTMWANNYLEMDDDGQLPLPLSQRQFNTFFVELWEPGSKPRRTRNTMREHFLNWLAGRSGLTVYEISERMRAALEELFNLMDSDLGSLNSTDLDPRFIQLFLFRSE